MDIPELFLDFDSTDALVRETDDDSPTPPPKVAPYYVDSFRGLRLYQGDALELLRRARSDIFDMVFADPPYFLSNNGVTCQSGKMVSVNKGKWDKSEGFAADHQFNLDWLRECQRLLKPNGTLWVSGTSHNIYSVGYALQTLGYKILNDIAWYKVNPPPNLACRYFTHATETVIWAAKNPKSKHVFHYPLMKQMNGGKQMQSLWHITPPARHEKRFGKHPTQKPETLLARIIQAATGEGDLILDPFCGSGTTGVVSVRFGRRFVGFDISEEYLELGAKRISDESGREIEQGRFALDTDNNVDKCTRGGVACGTLRCPPSHTTIAGSGLASPCRLLRRHCLS